MPAHCLDAENEVIELAAKARVSGLDPAVVFIREKGIAPDPAVSLLIKHGISHLTAQRRAAQRLEIKTLELDPMFFVKIREEIEREDNSPKGIRKKRVEAQRLAEAEKFRKSLQEKIASDCRKINAALEFFERWKLSDGTELGNAKKSQLLREAGREIATAEGHNRNAVFYERLSQQMNDDETVRQAISLERAHRIREEVFIEQLPEAA